MRVVAVPVKLHFQVLALVLFVAFFYGAFRLTQMPALRLPEFYFYDKSDQKMTLEDFRGRVVLVNLWATWCPPCVVELPSLGRLQEKLPREKFAIVAISTDNLSMKAVQRFLKAKGAKNLEIYMDKDQQVLLKLEYEGLPTSFLLNQNGIVVKTYAGALEWDQEPQLKEIRALLN